MTDIILRVAAASVVQTRVSQAVVANLKITAGLGGPRGAAGAGLNFVQSTPSATWTINHNLGYKPSVELFSTGGVEMMGQVIHSSINQTIVSFNSSVSGSARLT